ncbi:MAG: pyridine nucleotide transhydrogenase [Gemmatimonadetes bacterium]|nr:pyridine nucleotide transhydrogenase [Gemmatimonadota bacterium]
MNDALIGHTGFVGGTLLRARSFDACFRSTNIDAIRGRTFDTIYCCGAPAEKWRANRNPEEDRLRLATLTDALREARSTRFVLISTIDVYPCVNGPDERTPIDAEASEPYGLHRYALEQFCRAHFATTIVRLPGLYGYGLKKNAVFDLLNDRPLDGVPGNARFQFYDVARLHTDVEHILASGFDVVNITPEPVSMSDVAEQVFGRTMSTPYADDAPNYDVRSVHADLAGGRDGYWFSADVVFDGLRDFVASERAR